MNKLKELVVWQKAVGLTTEVYKLTKAFPQDERYGLVSQINRSAVSIASNIAEGAGRGSKKEFYNFLSFASGSSYELETQLIIANNLNYINTEAFNSITERVNEIQKMIFSLKKSLKNRISQDSLVSASGLKI